MKNSVMSISKELIELIKCVNGLETCRACRLGSFLDETKVYVTLKILILLPENQKITEEIGDDLYRRLEIYGTEKRIAIRASLEQLSIRYAVLSAVLQDNSSVDFNCVTYDRYQRNIKKLANRKKKEAEKKMMR